MTEATNPTSSSLSEVIAFHEPLRRRLVDLLAARGPCTVSTLAREVGAAVGSVSHHLRALEKAGFVEPAPELATDGRTSWWRLLDKTWSWSLEDFDAPADHHLARGAQRLAARHQGEVLRTWEARRESYVEGWRRSAFSSEVTTRATPDELADLLSRLDTMVQTWLASIPRDDDQEREPVVFFSHGLPFRP